MFSAQQDAIRGKCFHPTGTFVPFSTDAIGGSVASVFQEVAGKFADRKAVSDGSRAVTYDELNRMANWIARQIITHVGEGNRPVAMWLDNDATAVISALAILKAGKILVVIDPLLPRQRVAHYLSDSNAAAIITNGKYTGLASQLVESSITVISLDAIETEVSGSDLDIVIQPTAITQIIYTSGSTGLPKGVMRGDQRLSLLNTISRINRYHICCDDRFVALYEPMAGS